MVSAIFDHFCERLVWGFALGLEGILEMTSRHFCQARKSGFGNGQGTFLENGDTGIWNRFAKYIKTQNQKHQNAQTKIHEMPKAKCGKTRFQILEKRVEKTRPEQKKSQWGPKVKSPRGGMPCS